MKKCKKCPSRDAADDIAEMVAQVRSMRGIRLVPDAEYARRLGICGGCEKLEDGATCMLCGCVMQVRALLADGKCPYPKGGRW